MDLSKFENNNGVYYSDEMVESWDGIKFNMCSTGLKTASATPCMRNLNFNLTINYIDYGRKEN